MCGRMNISDHEGVQWLLRSIGLMTSPVQAPKFNVAPTRQLDAVIMENDEPVLTSMSWGVSMKTKGKKGQAITRRVSNCLLYTSPSPRDGLLSRMPSSA